MEQEKTIKHPVLKGLDKSTIFSDISEKALRKLELIGFPKRETEEWKYTRVNKLLKSSYHPKSEASLKEFNNWFFPDIKGPTIVLENGNFNPYLSCLGDNSGLNIETLDNVNKSVIEDNFGSMSYNDQNAFSLFNLAYFQNGCYIEVEKKNIIEQTVHVVHLSTDNQTLVNSRLMIHVNDFSELNLVQSFVNNSNTDAFVNHVTEIKLGVNAKLSIDKIQQVEGEQHICTEYVDQSDESTFKINTLTTDGKLVRNGLNIYVNGENCNSFLNGLFIPKNENHFDNHTLLEHKKPNCHSSECYKGIIDDAATGVFNGKVIVHEDAQKIMAYQQNNNIVLSDKAQINAKPELEIYADDVKCSHGSTTGQFDEEALFYLMARGIKKESAINLLMNGFISEVIEEVESVEVKNYFLNRFN